MAEIEKGLAKPVGMKMAAKPGKEIPHPKPMERGRSGRFFYRLGMLISRLGVDIEVRGLENLPTDSPYILAANHETFVDGMWIMSALPKDQFQKFCCIGAQDLLTKYGPFGKIIMRVGRGIPINRNGNPARALISAKEALEEGSNILLIHPEGTRSKDGTLGQIHEGACFIAKKSKSPLVPVFLDGAYNIFNPNMALPAWHNPETKKRHRLIITFGKVLDAKNYPNIKEMNQVLTDWFHDRFANKEIPNINRPKKKSAQNA